MDLKLGKLPATDDPRDLRLSAYLDRSVLPSPPAAFGHQDQVETWGMLGNDRAGDCVWAGAAHETLLWNVLGGHPVAFDDRTVLSDYAAVTGYDPSTGANDDGTDMRAAARYRRKVGIVDVTGARHRIGAFVSLNDDVLELLATGAWLFDAVGIGVQFPRTAMDQFNAGQPWDVVDPGPGQPPVPIDGGHYVPLVGRDAEDFLVVTWGRVQRVTPRFLATYCDEAFAYLTEESLASGRSPEGFELDQLRADLRSLANR